MVVGPSSAELEPRFGDLLQCDYGPSDRSFFGAAEGHLTLFPTPAFMEGGIFSGAEGTSEGRGIPHGASGRLGTEE